MTATLSYFLNPDKKSVLQELETLLPTQKDPKCRLQFQYQLLECYRDTGHYRNGDLLCAVLDNSCRKLYGDDSQEYAFCLSQIALFYSVNENIMKATTYFGKSIVLYTQLGIENYDLSLTLMHYSVFLQKIQTADSEVLTYLGKTYEEMKDSPLKKRHHFITA